MDTNEPLLLDCGRLLSPDNQYGDGQNDGDGKQEEAIGVIHEQEMTQAKTGAVNSGSSEGPINARSDEVLIPT